MWFSIFRHYGPSSSHPPERGEEPRSWRWGLADEVEAWLAGRLGDYLANSGRRVPTWAVLNRLAHADRDVLVRLSAGGRAYPITHPACGSSPWLIAEQIVAGQLVECAETPEQLWLIQQATLIPLELSFAERAKTEQLNPERVISAAAEALENFGSDR